MKINCLFCGHKVDLDDAYGDYVGQVKCFVCNSLLEIKIDEGHLKSVKLAKSVTRLVAEKDPDLSP